MPWNTPIMMAGAILANARAFVSGRFHPAIFASLGGTPCVFLDAHSHKMASLQKTLEYDVHSTFPAMPVGRDIDEIASLSQRYIAEGDSLREQDQGCRRQALRASRAVAPACACLPMTMTPIVLIGGGGHAKVVSALVAKIGKYRIVGYTALAAGALPRSFAPYLGEDHALPDLVASGRISGAVLGIGIVDVDADRAALRKRLIALGLALPSIVSPMAVVNTDVVIGDGTVVMDGVVINPGAKIGECSIINTNATVEHDCTIGDCSHIAPGAVLCGGSIGGGAVDCRGGRLRSSGSAHRGALYRWRRRNRHARPGRTGCIHGQSRHKDAK